MHKYLPLFSYTVLLVVGYTLINFYSSCMTRSLDSNNKKKLSKYYHSRSRIHKLYSLIFITLIIVLLLLSSAHSFSLLAHATPNQLTLWYKIWFFCTVATCVASQMHDHTQMKIAQLPKKYLINHKILSTLHAIYIGLIVLSLHTLFPSVA